MAKNDNLKPYFEASSALIVDPTSVSRTSVRKLLLESGAQSRKLDIAETYEEALQKIEKLKPKILFTEFELGKNSGLELFALQKKHEPDRSKTIFIVLSDKNSAAVSAAVADIEADALIVRPFTFAQLKEKVLEIVEAKLKPSDYMKRIEEAKKLIAEKKYAEAEKKLLEAAGHDAKPALAHYWRSVALKAQGKLEEARAALEKGLAANPEHYKCLFGLFDLYQETKQHAKAYELGAKIGKVHAFPPKRIPDLIHLSVVNQKYEDILGFYDIFSSLEKPDEALVSYIGAGFVICGKYLLRKGSQAEGVAALKKAELIARTKPKILCQAVATYFAAGLEREAEEMLMRLPEAVRDSEELVTLVLDQLRGKSAESALKFGLEHLNKGFKDPKFYSILIQESIKLKRPQRDLDNLVFKAAEALPEKKAEFESMAKGS